MPPPFLPGRGHGWKKGRRERLVPGRPREPACIIAWTRAVDNDKREGKVCLLFDPFCFLLVKNYGKMSSVGGRRGKAPPPGAVRWRGLLYGQAIGEQSLGVSTAIGGRGSGVPLVRDAGPLRRPMIAPEARPTAAAAMVGRMAFSMGSVVKGKIEHGKELTAKQACPVER